MSGGVPRIGRPTSTIACVPPAPPTSHGGACYEGHVNALQLIGRSGTGRQRLRAKTTSLTAAYSESGIRKRRTACTYAACRLGATVTMAGRKTFASGAGRVARARSITFAWPEGSATQLAIVPMDRVHDQDRPFVLATIRDGRFR